MPPETITPIPAQVTPQQDHDHAGMPKTDCRMLFVIEIGEENLAWTSVGLCRKKCRPMYRGGVEIGYGDIDSLSEWFKYFWETAGEHKHEIHLVITGPETLERTFVIPVVPRSELSIVVKNQARKVFPLDVEKGLFGWKVIGKVRRASEEKYQIYSLLLGEHWHGWLKKIFGKRLDFVTLITSSGQQFENYLNEIEDEFKSKDSYLVRLKGKVVETGFFHDGYLEFFREVPVESLSNGGTVAELRRIVGIEEEEPKDDESDQELVIKELKSIIVDALDYYQGQFGQRKIATAYLCMPDNLSGQVTEFIQSSFGTDVINLCSTVKIAEHCKLARVEQVSSSYSLWVTAFPKRKINTDILNLLPDSIRDKKKESVLFRWSLVGFALVLLTISVLSAVKIISINSIDDGLAEYRRMVADIESSPALSTLAERKVWTDELTKSYSQIHAESGSSFKSPLLLLSDRNMEDVRLNKVIINYGSSGESSIDIDGEVIGNPNRQEAVLYMYLSELEKHPAVKEFKLLDKGNSIQSGVKKTVFSLRLVVQS